MYVYVFVCSSFEGLFVELDTVQKIGKKYWWNVLTYTFGTVGFEGIGFDESSPKQSFS